MPTWVPFQYHVKRRIHDDTSEKSDSYVLPMLANVSLRWMQAIKKVQILAVNE